MRAEQMSAMMTQFRGVSRTVCAALTLSIFLRVVVAQNLTIATCASPDTFRTCFTQVEDFHTQCYINAKTVEEGAACDCVQNAGLINCAYESCWNVIYGCEMQRIFQSYVVFCEVPRYIPFFPAPDNAPGGCSCNIGQVTLGIAASQIYIGQCASSSNLSLDRLAGCNCCDAAGVYTSLYEICPTVDPEYLIWLTVPTFLSTLDPQFPSCGPYLSEYNCESDLGYPPISTYEYLSALPETTGTGSYSATGSLTTPISPTLTWTYAGVVTTITAVGSVRNNDNNNNGNNNGNGNGNPSTTGGRGAQDGGTQTDGSSSPTKTGGVGINRAGGSIWGIAMITVVVVVLVV